MLCGMTSLVLHAVRNAYIKREFHWEKIPLLQVIMSNLQYFILACSYVPGIKTGGVFLFWEDRCGTEREYSSPTAKSESSVMVQMRG